MRDSARASSRPRFVERARDSSVNHAVCARGHELTINSNTLYFPPPAPPRLHPLLTGLPARGGCQLVAPLNERLTIFLSLALSPRSLPGSVGR